MLLVCCCVFFGVVGVIYEVCFNVIIDIVVLCLKTGNVVILCGGKEMFFFNMELVKVIQLVLDKVGLLVVFVQYIEKLDCELVM